MISKLGFLTEKILKVVQKFIRIFYITTFIIAPYNLEFRYLEDRNVNFPLMRLNPTIAVHQNNYQFSKQARSRELETRLVYLPAPGVAAFFKLL